MVCCLCLSSCFFIVYHFLVSMIFVDVIMFFYVIFGFISKNSIKFFLHSRSSNLSLLNLGRFDLNIFTCSLQAHALMDPAIPINHI